MTTITIPINGHPVTFTSEVPKEEGAYLFVFDDDTGSEVSVCEVDLHEPTNTLWVYYAAGIQEPITEASGFWHRLAPTQERDDARKVAKELAGLVRECIETEYDEATSAPWDKEAKAALAAFERMEGRG